MQVSSPTQGPSPPYESGVKQEGSVGENQKADSPVLQGAQKKNKEGVFAKLLEGLQAKVTKSAANSGNPEDEGKISEKAGDNASASAKAAAKTPNKQVHFSGTQKTQEFLLEGNNPDTEAVDGRFLAVFRQHSGEETVQELASLVQTGLDEPGLAQADVDFQGENLLKEINPKETKAREISPKDGFRDFMARGEGEGQNSSPDALESQANVGESEQAANHGDKAKNPRNAGFRSNFREMEAEFHGNQSWQTKAELNPGTLTRSAEREDIKLSDSRGRKGRERLNVEVRDLRTAESRGAGQPEGGVSFKEAFSSRVSGIELPIDLNLREKGAGGKTGDTFSRSLTFEDALAKELRGQLSTDIVRNAAIIVRNGGEGTIRLSLHPASLGDVKIRLEMTENKITGHIIVESNDALRAFERELPVLEKAFRDSGFSETNLEMFLSQDGGNYASQEQERDFLNQLLAASGYEAGTEGPDGYGGFEESGESDLFDSSALSRDGMIFSPGRTPVNLLV